MRTRASRTAPRKPPGCRTSRSRKPPASRAKTRTLLVLQRDDVGIEDIGLHLQPDRILRAAADRDDRIDRFAGFAEHINGLVQRERDAFHDRPSKMNPLMRAVHADEAAANDGIRMRRPFADDIRREQQTFAPGLTRQRPAAARRRTRPWRTFLKPAQAVARRQRYAHGIERILLAMVEEMHFARKSLHARRSRRRE